MRKILLGTALFLTLGASAQVTMRQVFKDMPQTMIPYMTGNNRLDMIDFIDSNMKAEVRNEMDGKSEMKILTDDYAFLTLNEASTLEIRLLDVNEEVDSTRQVVCVVRTFGSDIRESTVDFYSVRWRKLETAAYVQLPFVHFLAKLDERDRTLTLKSLNDFERPASEEQKVMDEVQKTFKWNGEVFN